MKKQLVHKIRLSRKTKKLLKKLPNGSFFYRVWLVHSFGSQYAKHMRKYFCLTL